MKLNQLQAVMDSGGRIELPRGYGSGYGGCRVYGARGGVKGETNRGLVHRLRGVTRQLVNGVMIVRKP